MILRDLNYILLISVALLAFSGCVAEEKADVSAFPKDNLPAGFSLLTVITESTQGVNMTEEIEDFYGAQDIGPANATVGIYIWAPLGEGYDSKITLIRLQDEERAKSAVTNYKALPEFKTPPYKGIDRFSTAIVNGHEVTEIRDDVGENGLRYIYLWSSGSTVILVEGNADRSKSIELASVMGL